MDTLINGDFMKVSVKIILAVKSEPNESNEPNSSDESKSIQHETEPLSTQNRNSMQPINHDIETIELAPIERNVSSSSQESNSILDKTEPNSTQKRNCCHVL